MFDPLRAPVDYFEVAGRRSPGVAELEGVTLARTIDERKGFGLMGATTVVKGQKLARFTAKVRLFEPAHFDAWQTFVDVLRRFNPRQDRLRGFTFSHPQTDQLGISAVVVEEIASPVQTGDGEWTASIKLVEHRRPRPMLATTDGADAGAASPDPVDQEIERLTRQVQELAQ